MSRPTTVEGVIARLREIDAALPRADGVAVFNRVYLATTERVAQAIDDPGVDDVVFKDPETMAQLDVEFANLWLTAYDDAEARRAVSPAWRPLFKVRTQKRLPVQYALAGMNAHIEHDLPLAVVRTCLARGMTPEQVHGDFEVVNDVLAEIEARIRRSFLDHCQREVDDHVGPIAHLVSTWSIDKARDLAWVTTETIWALRDTRILRDRFIRALAHTVGMTSRSLLVPAS